jgi:LysM repeat protein
MSTTNPFQIPSCFQISQQQRRRERFKKGVITAVALLIALLVGLLIQGCVSQHAEETTVTPLGANSSAPQTGAAPDAAPSPSPVILMTKPTASVAAPVVPTPVVSAEPLPAPLPTPVTPTQAAVPQPGAAGYIVKRGDTLARIARAHHTTVKTIQTINSLASDRIIIGEKLKLPQV